MKTLKRLNRLLFLATALTFLVTPNIVNADGAGQNCGGDFGSCPSNQTCENGGCVPCIDGHCEQS